MRLGAAVCRASFIRRTNALSIIVTWLVAWAAGNAEGQDGSSQGGFIFDTSGERPLTMPFRLNVGLLGFGSDQLQSGASLDAVEIESALMVRRRCRRRRRRRRR
jgi:hypothetical protein